MQIKLDLIFNKYIQLDWIFSKNQSLKKKIKFKFQLSFKFSFKFKFNFNLKFKFNFKFILKFITKLKYKFKVVISNGTNGPPYSSSAYHYWKLLCNIIHYGNEKDRLTFEKVLANADETSSYFITEENKIPGLQKRQCSV